MSEDTEQREPEQLDGVPLPEWQAAVVGHGHALADLRARLSAGRLPGGILLHGPRGIGKATLAFEIAREAFAATGDETPEHIAAQVAAGAYPNLFVVRRRVRVTTGKFKTVITLDQIRRPPNPDRDSEPIPLRERLQHTRGRKGHRIVIMDSIDDCNEDSANALLKVLEEPPADTTFILVSHRPGSLLPTIRSRCHPIALRPLADGDVRAVIGANHPGLPATDLDRAVSLAQGSPRRAFEALLLGDAGVLSALRAWLADPASPRPAAHLAIGDGLAAARDGAEARFGRDMLLGWMASEAKAAARAGPGARRRLASANELWDKALALFADTDEYNLDVRQTVVTILDAVKRHAQSHLAVTEPT